MPRVLVAALALVAGGNNFALADKAPADAWWQKCVAIANDRQRLDCFDHAAPAAPGPALPASPSPPRPSLAAAESLPPREAFARPVRPRPARFRIALGYGLGVAAHDGSFVVNHGQLESLSGFGNSGGTVLLQGWMTGWPGRHWMTGLEYLHFDNLGRFNLNLPRGLSVLTDPVTGNMRADVSADVGFANLAYAPFAEAPLRPYLGAGLGGGFGRGHFSLYLHNDFIGTTNSISNGSSAFAALQGFLGADIPVYRPYYVGLDARAFWVSAHPVGVDQRYLDFIFTISVGREF